MYNCSFRTMHRILNSNRPSVQNGEAQSPCTQKSLKSNITSFQQSVSTCKRSKCFPVGICAAEAMQQKGERERGWEPRGEGHIFRTVEMHPWVTWPLEGKQNICTDSSHCRLSKQMSQTEPLLSLQDAEQLCRRLGMQQFQQVFVGNETKWLLFIL